MIRDCGTACASTPMKFSSSPTIACSPQITTKRSRLSNRGYPPPSTRFSAKPSSSLASATTRKNVLPSVLSPSLCGAEKVVEFGKGNGPVKTAETAFLRNQLGRAYKAGPRCARERRTDADTAHTHVREISHFQADVIADENVHRFWSEFRNDCLDFLTPADTRSIQNIRTRLCIRLKAADRFLERVGVADKIAFGSSGQ